MRVCMYNARGREEIILTSFAGFLPHLTAYVNEPYGGGILPVELGALYAVAEATPQGTSVTHGTRQTSTSRHTS